MQPARTHRTLGIVGILLAVLLWGVFPFVVDRIRKEMSPGELTFMRLILPGLFLTLLVGPRRLLHAIRRNWLLFFLLAFVGFTLPQLFYVYALQSELSVPLLNFIASSYPVLSVALAILILKERPTLLHGIALAAAIVGLYLLAGADLSAGHQAALGIMWALLAAIGWAFSGVAGKRMTANLPPMTIVAGRHLLGGILVVPMLFFETPRAHTAGAWAWAAIALLVVMSIASYYWYYRGLAHTPVSSAALLESFQPVITLAVGFLLGRPGMSPPQLLGAALVLAGAVMVSVHELAAHRRLIEPPGL